MDKFTRRALLVGGALLSKVSRPNLVGTNVANITDLEITYPQDLVGQTLRLNVIRSLLGTNQLYEITFDSNNITDIIEKINSKGRTFVLGQVVDIFRAELTRDVLSITVLDMDADGLEVLNSEAAKILGFFASPDTRGISLIENWRYSIPGPNKQNLGVGTYLVKHEDRTSESINRAIDSVSRNTEELDREIRNPEVIESTTEKFFVYGRESNQFFACVVHQEGSWIEGPLDYIRSNYAQDLSDALADKFTLALSQKNNSAEFKYRLALDIIEDPIFGTSNIRSTIISKLRNSSFLYSPVKDVISEDDRTIVLFNEHTKLPEIENNSNSARPWNTKNGYSVITGVNPNIATLDDWGSYADINVNYGNGIAFSSESAAYAEFAGSFLGPIISNNENRITLGTVKDYCTITLSETLSEDTEIRVALESNSSEFIVLTECGVFELESLSGTQLTVKPWSGDLNKFFLAPNNNFVGSEHLLNPGQSIRVCLFVGRKLPLGMFLAGYDNNAYSVSSDITSDNFTVDISSAAKSVIVYSERTSSNNYLEDIYVKKEEVLFKNLFLAADPYVLTNTYASSLRNLFSCATRYTRFSIDAPDSNKVIIARNSNNRYFGANTNRGVNYSSGNLHGISKNLFDEYGDLISGAVDMQYRMEHVTPENSFRLSGIVKNVYESCIAWWNSSDPILSPALEVDKFLKTKNFSDGFTGFFNLFLSSIYGDNWKNILSTSQDDLYIPHPSDASIHSDYVLELQNAYNYIISVAPYSNIPFNLECSVSLTSALIVTLDSNTKSPYSASFDSRDLGRVFYLKNSSGIDTAVRMSSILSPRKALFELADAGINIGIVFFDVHNLNNVKMSISPSFGIQTSGHSSITHKKSQIIYDTALNADYSNSNRYACGIPIITETLPALFKTDAEDTNYSATNMVETRDLLIAPVATKFSLKNASQEESRYPVNLTITAPLDFIAYAKEGVDSVSGKYEDFYNFNGNIEHHSSKNAATYNSAHDYAGKHISLWEKIDLNFSDLQRGFTVDFEESIVRLNDLFKDSRVSNSIAMSLGDFIDIVTESRYFYSIFYDRIFEYLKEVYIDTLLFPRVELFSEWLVYLAGVVEPTKIFNVNNVEAAKKALIKNLADTILPPGISSQHTKIKSDLKSTYVSFEMLKAVNAVNEGVFIDDLFPDSVNNLRAEAISRFVSYLVLAGVDFSYYHPGSAVAAITYDNFVDHFLKSDNFTASSIYDNIFGEAGGADIVNSVVAINISGNLNKLIFNLSNVKYLRDVELVTNTTQNIALNSHLKGVESGIGTHNTLVVNTNISSLKARANDLVSLKVNTNGKRSAPLGYSILNRTDNASSLKNYVPRYSKGLRPWYFSRSEATTIDGVTDDIIQLVTWVNSWYDSNIPLVQAVYANLGLVHKVLVTNEMVTGSDGSITYYLSQKSIIGVFRDISTMDTADPDIIIIPQQNAINKEEDASSAEKLTLYRQAIFLELLNFKHCVQTDSTGLDQIETPSEVLTTSTGVLIYPEYITDSTNASKVVNFNYDAELLELNSETREALSHFYSSSVEDTTFLSKATTAIESVGDYSNRKEISSSSNSVKSIAIRGTSETFSDNKALLDIDLLDNYVPYILQQDGNMQSAFRVHSNSITTSEFSLDLRNSKFLNHTNFGENIFRTNKSLYVTSYGDWQRTYDPSLINSDGSLLSYSSSRNFFNTYSSPVRIQKDDQLYEYNLYDGGSAAVATTTSEISSAGGPALLVSNTLSDSNIYLFNKSALASILHKDYLKNRISIKYSFDKETHYERKIGSDVGNTIAGFGYYGQNVVDEYSRPSTEPENDSKNLATLYSLGTNKIQGILRISGDAPDSIYDQCNLMASAHLNAGIHGHLNPVESARATKYWSFVSLSELVAKHDSSTYLKYVISGEEDADVNSNIGADLVNFSPARAPSNTILDITVDPRKRFGKSNSPSQLGEKVASYSFNYAFNYRPWQDHSVEDTAIGPVFIKSMPVYNTNGEIDSGISINYFVSRDTNDPRDGFRFILSRPNLSLGEASIGRTIVFKLSCIFPWKYDSENNEVPYKQKVYRSPYFEGIIADIIIHDGKNERSVNSRLGTVEVIVVPSARRFDQVNYLIKAVPNLLPKNFFEVDPQLRLLHEGRRVDGYGVSEPEWQHGYYYNLLALCESGYENGGRVWAWDYPGIVDDWQNSQVTEHQFPELFSIRLEGVVHGREWTLNAFQAAISDRLFLLDDLGNNKMSIYAEREGDVFIEGNGDNLVFKNWDNIILGEDHAPKKDVSVIVTCAIRRMLRKLTEYEYNNYNEVGAHDYAKNSIYADGDKYYLVVDEGMYTKMSYDWLVNGVSNSVTSLYSKGLNYTHSELPDSLKGMDIQFNYISQYLGRDRQLPRVGVTDRDTMTAEAILYFAWSPSVTLPNGNDIDEIPEGTYIIFNSNTRLYDQNNVEYRMEIESLNVPIYISPFGYTDPILINRIDNEPILYGTNLDLNITLPTTFTIYYPTIYVNIDGSIDTTYNDCLDEHARIRNDYENFASESVSFNLSETPYVDDIDSNFSTLESELEVTAALWGVLEGLEADYNDEVDRVIEELPDLYYFNLSDYDGSFNFVLAPGIGSDIELNYEAWEGGKTECLSLIGQIEIDLALAEANGSLESYNFNYPSDFKDSSLSTSLTYRVLSAGSSSELENETKENFANDQGLTLSELDAILSNDDTACEDNANNPDRIEVVFKDTDLIYQSTQLTAEKNKYLGTILNNLGVLTDKFWCNWYGTGDNYYGYPLSSEVTSLVQAWESETGPTTIGNHTYPIATWISNNSAADKFVSIVNRLYRGNSTVGWHEWAYPLAGILNALKYPIITMPSDWDLSKVNVVDLTGSPVSDLLVTGSNSGDTMKHRRSAFGLDSNNNATRLKIDGNYIDNKSGLNEYNESYIKNWSVIDQAQGSIDEYNSFDYTNYSSRQNASNVGRIIYKPNINQASPLYSYRTANRVCFTQQGPGANHSINARNVQYSEDSSIFLQDVISTGGPFGALGKVNGTLSQHTLSERTLGLYINFDIEKINQMVGSAHPYNTYGVHWKDKYVAYNFGTLSSGDGTVVDEELLDRTSILNTGNVDPSTGLLSYNLHSRYIPDTAEDQNDNYSNYKIESTYEGKDMCVDAIIKFRIDLELTKKEYNTSVGVPLSRIRHPVINVSGNSSAPSGSTGLSLLQP